MVDETRQSDIVDAAFEALRRTQPPEGPSSQALEQTLQAAYQAQQKSNRISLVERIRKMNKLIKYPITAALTLAVLAGAAYLLLGSHAEMAFADVRQQIEQTQTMTVTGITEMKGMDKPVVMKLYFKFPGLMRREIPVEASAATAPGTTQTGGAPAARKVVSIIDTLNKKSVTFSPDRKKAIVCDLTDAPADVLAREGGQNLLDELKKAVAGEHDELGDKTIGGLKAKGYRCTNELKMTMDIWVDSSTGKPILVEQVLPEGMGKVVLTDFVLNPRLDDSLFDTTVPEGYSTETEKVDFNIKESDLIDALRLLIKYDGVFPRRLLPMPDLMKQLKKTPISQEENKELAMRVSRMFAFQMRIQAGGEFVYAGEGVKLSDNATPILWYKAKDAKTYRVIYGDLHAEDSAAVPKRPASQPAT